MLLRSMSSSSTRRTGEIKNSPTEGENVTQTTTGSNESWLPEDGIWVCPV